MKQSARKYGALLLVLIIVTGVCFLFSYRKAGMFIDEIYTYGLSNSFYAPFLRDVAGDTLVDQVITKQQFFDYMMVDEGDGFAFGSVYYNQVNDVHPPLYYWLFNIASSLTPGVFSKWTGLVLDYIIYMAALILLYMLVYKLFGSRANAAAAAAMYGLSLIGLSTMLMIRMYVLLTALTVLLAYLIASLLREKKFYLYPLIALTVFLGVMTQYYYVFYAFFLCAATVFYLLFKREFKACVLFSLFAFLGVGMLPLCFPACIDQLFAESLVSGGSALDNLKAVWQYKERILFIVKEVGHGTKAAIIVALALIPLLLLCGKKLVHAIKSGSISFDSLIVIIPAFVTLVLVAIISPVSDQRYVYNIIPIFICAVSFLLYLLEKCTEDLPKHEILKYAALTVILVFSLWHAKKEPPLYIYPEYLDYNILLQQYTETPCVYMTDDYFAPVTQDLLQLMNFEEVFLTDRADSTALGSYLSSANSDECVVYIDISKFWSSGFDSEEMLSELLENTEYTKYENLYQNGLSDTYLLTK